MAYPSDSARTKDWGKEILTDSDLEAQLDILHSWINAAMNGTTGHGHTGGTNDAPKISAATGLTIASQAQGDVLYASSASAWARLGAGTAGMFLKTLGAAANPAWAYAPIFKLSSTTRDLSTATGDQAITGVGFTPRLLLLIGAQDNNARMSIGIDDLTNRLALSFDDAGNKWQVETTVSVAPGTGSDKQVAYVSAVGSDGFTLSWTKSGTPTGTFTLFYLAIQ